MKSFLLPALVALLFIAGCSRHDATSAVASLPAAKVRLSAVQGADLPLFTEATGTVRPVRRAAIAAKVMGVITQLPVVIGQPVQAGDTLIKLAAEEVTAKVAQAQAQLNMTRRDLERERTLLNKGASTVETVNDLEDRLTGCEALVREAEAQLSYTTIKAPFGGVVSRKPANLGDLAVPGQTLVEVEETANFEVEACVPDSLVAALVPGATLECEAAGIRFTGILREVSSATDTTTRTIGVKIGVPAGTAVRSGQFTRVQVPGAKRRALLVPAAAVSLHGQMERVFVAGEGSRAALRIVKTGSRHGDLVEILSGLDATDRVVIDPPASLREGQPLEASS